MKNILIGLGLLSIIVFGGLNLNLTQSGSKNGITLANLSIMADAIAECDYKEAGYVCSEDAHGDEYCQFGGEPGVYCTD